jgi:hypothetical protein
MTARDSEGHCRAHGIAAQIRYRIDNNETLVGLAARDLGATLLPRLAVDPARRGVVPVALAVEPPPRLIALVWHRDREQSQAARVLIELARRLCMELGQSSHGSRGRPNAGSRDLRPSQDDLAHAPAVDQHSVRRSTIMTVTAPAVGYCGKHLCRVTLLR